MRKLFFFICLFLFPLYLFSQSLFVCDGITADGQPINSTHTLVFQNFSAYSFVAFHSTDATNENYVLVVSKKSENIYSQLCWMKMNRATQNSFYTSTVNWVGDGDYKLSVMHNGTEKTSEYFTVDVNENDEMQNSSDYDANKYNDPTNTFYFIDSRVGFCKNETEAGNINLETNTLKAGDVTVVVTSTGKPFTTNSLRVMIYKVTGKDNDEELLEEKEVAVNPTDESVHFQYHFSVKGNYTVSVYTTESVWINDGSIQIK